MAIADNAHIIQLMQRAVDSVIHSEHHFSKVAACLFDKDGNICAEASFRPRVLQQHFAWDARLGSSSQFVHAEAACIMNFDGVLEGASICITDPFCPNCAKILAEVGIKNVFIDHKGFEKDFISRNAGEFEQMSMPIVAKAGMNVYVVNRKQNAVTPILEQEADAPTPIIDRYELFDIPENQDLNTLIMQTAQRVQKAEQEFWSFACVRNQKTAQKQGLLVYEALPPGFSKITGDMFHSQKYSYYTQALTRLFLIAKRLQLPLEAERVWTFGTPSARAVVNALGFGLWDLILLEQAQGIDTEKLAVLTELANKEILKISFYNPSI